MGFNAKEMMDEFSKENFPTEIGSIKRVGLFQQTDGELRKRQEVDVQERAALLNAEKPLETPSEGIGRNNDRQWSERIRGFEVTNFLDKGLFKVRMKGTGDDLEHYGNRLRLRFSKDTKSSELYSTSALTSTFFVTPFPDP
ncbi:MAG: hypothetical protein ACREI2_15755 [Nitrospiraceae bacterium]